jgi:hypothetical protein
MQRLKRKAYRMTRLHRKLQREEQESQLTEEWQNAVKLEEIVVPEEFSGTPAMRLWYLARCDAKGQFMANVIDLSDPSLQMAHDPWSSSMYSPWNRLLRRFRIAAQLVPLIFPSLVQLVLDTAGPRLLFQFAAEIAVGLCKFVAVNSINLSDDHSTRVGYLEPRTACRRRSEVAILSRRHKRHHY